MFEVVIEESPISSTQTYAERTKVVLGDAEMQIVHEFFNSKTGEWEAWDDMGAHVEYDKFWLIAGLVENRQKIVNAAKEIK